MQSSLEDGSRLDAERECQPRRRPVSRCDAYATDAPREFLGGAGAVMSDTAARLRGGPMIPRLDNIQYQVVRCTLLGV